MCGGHHIVGSIVGEVVRESRRDHGEHRSQYEKPQPSITQEVKLMYARGDIDSATYHRLLEMARSGELNWDDLAEIRRGASVAPAAPTTPAATRERDTDIVRALNRLYQHRTRLEASQRETEQVLERLEADAARLRQQAETAAEKAKAVADTDEASARAYLEVRQEALDRVQALEERITALRQDLARIEDLRAELATREAELKALEAREQLAELEASIREDLLQK
ncbi:MAG: hypothetical protein GXP42_06840 [Chloroflexi bacterium]|nr:hypothetical protein [Chloroflexota bacterium]